MQSEWFFPIIILSILNSISVYNHASGSLQYGGETVQRLIVTNILPTPWYYTINCVEAFQFQGDIPSSQENA